MSRYAEVATRLASGGVDLFTCDVFDTLVWRPVARPPDVFVELAQRLVGDGRLPGDTDPVEFGGARQAAELDARQITQVELRTPECTIEEIWASMPAAVVGTTSLNELVEAELACEQRHLRVHQPVAALLADAHARGITTALVSDSYLSPDQLAKLLAAVGVDMTTIDRVVTSSAARINKAGGLLGRVIADTGCPPQRCLHLGDNLFADIEPTELLGASAILAELEPSDRAVVRPIPAVVAYSDRSGSDGGLHAAVRETLLEADQAGRSGAFQFGAAIVGPALAGYAKWAAATTEQLGASTIHCLLREGAVLAEMIEVIAPGGPATRLVHGSRWAMTRASVFTGSEAEILACVERREWFRAEHLAAAFDLTLGDVQAVVGTQPIHHHRRVEAIAAIAADDGLRNQILERSAVLRSGVLAYLTRTLDPDALAGHQPLVLTDIGWGGKIQATIDALLSDAGYSTDVVGLYLMLSTTGVRRRRYGERLLSYLPETHGSATATAAAEIVQKYAAVVERVATPELGTLLEFTASGQPVCRPPESQPTSLVTAREAMRAVTAKLVELGALDSPTWLDRPFRSALLDDLADALAAPTTLLAADLATWEHDDLGGSDPATLFSGPIAALAGFVNPAQADEVGWDEIFWLPGLAAVANPTLNAQMTAIRDGVDAQALAPASETGMARIAAFPIGSQLATHQVETVPRRSAAGWSLLRLHTVVPSLRSLRLDACDQPAIVQLGLLDARIATAAGNIDLALSGFDDRRLTWVGGRALSPELAAFEGGGHLLIEIARLGVDGDIEGVDIDWAFRTWPLADPALARPSAVTRTINAGRQVASRARRATGR